MEEVACANCHSRMVRLVYGHGQGKKREIKGLLWGERGTLTSPKKKDCVFTH